MNYNALDTKMINKWTRGHGNKRTSGEHQNYCITEISQNNGKSP